LVDPENTKVSIAAQCDLLGLPRSSYYHEPLNESELNLKLMRLIDEEYLNSPTYGSRRMAAILNRAGYCVNRKRIQRLMRIMGLEAIYPKRNLSLSQVEHKKYPYLLRNMRVEGSNQVWSTDITYIPMTVGFLYLVAVMDWYSRMILSRELSNSLNVSFCITALETALRKYDSPEIFNTDQGSQFTSPRFCEIHRR
jgi:putative transposase